VVQNGTALQPRRPRTARPKYVMDEEEDEDEEDEVLDIEEESDYEPMSDVAAEEEDDDEYTEADVYRSKREERERQQREERIARDREEAERVAKENLRRSTRKRGREETEGEPGEGAEEAPRKRTRGTTKGRVEIVLEPIVIAEPAEVLEPRHARLRSSWQVLAMLHFLEHFREALKLPEAASSTAILDALASQRKSDLLLEVLDCVLRHNRAYRKSKEWYRMLYNAHNRHLDHFPGGNPLDDKEEEEFFSQDSLDKAVAIYWVCEWALEDSETLRNQVHDWRRDESMMRPLPIGYDREGGSFWRFGSNIESPCMFREEEHEPEVGAEAWTLECKTAEDWRQLQERLKESKHEDEKEFYSYITEELIEPVLEAEQREQHIQKRMRKWAMNEANILDRPRSRRTAASRRYTFSEYDNL